MNSQKLVEYWTNSQKTIYTEDEIGNFHTDLIPKVIDIYSKYLPQDKKSTILDIGCGQGIFIHHLENMGYDNVAGVTLSHEDYEACKNKNYEVFFSDFSDISVKNSSIDFIWCRHAIEHSPAPLFTLYEFNRILKTGGHAYIEVPVPDSLRIHENNPNHYSVLGVKMWKSLIAKSGFQLVASQVQKVNINFGNALLKEDYYSFVIKK